MEIKKNFGQPMKAFGNIGNGISVIPSDRRERMGIPLEREVRLSLQRHIFHKDSMLYVCRFRCHSKRGTLVDDINLRLLRNNNSKKSLSSSTLVSLPSYMTYQAELGLLKVFAPQFSLQPVRHRLLRWRNQILER